MSNSKEQNQIEQIQNEVKQEEDPSVLESAVKKVKLEEQPLIMQEQITKQSLFISLQQFLQGFGITDILQFVEDSIGQFENTQHQVIDKKIIANNNIIVKDKKVKARIFTYQNNKFYHVNKNFHVVFIQIRKEFSKYVKVGQQKGIVAQQELYRQYLEFQNEIRIRTQEYQNSTSTYIVNFIMLLCKFHIYCINKTKFEHYYQDLLILFAQEKLLKPINLCLLYLKGEKSFQQIQSNNFMGENEWKELQVILKNYYEIGRNYYKSHCCDYSNYIVHNKLEEISYKDWMSLSLNKQNKQCVAGKKKFKEMVNKIRDSNNKELQQHMQDFTTFEHHKFLFEGQNKILQLSQYFDDIYNCMILYPFVDVNHIKLDIKQQHDYFEKLNKE